ncbi:MAG TPA: efflux RND transporter permease subunit [Terriglobales bacterium]|nr:efflux RND transporter permease subunit [Terriglobales bacterium]
MSLSTPFIKRPVATTLITVAIAIAGAIAYTVLPAAPLPQVDFPTININAGLPGASAEIMASSVATPLERQLGHIAGTTEMTSSSQLGNTNITLQFDLSRNIDGAARDVEAAINAARTYLPANLPSNPTYRKVNPADAPIMILALTSDVYNKGQMYDAASTILAQRISQILGVGQVVAVGASPPAVRVELNPTQMNSYGISFQSIENTLRLANAHLALGQVSSRDTTLDIVANDQMKFASDYRPLIIGQHNGAAVRLSDVATVLDGVQNVRTAGYMDGKPSVTMIIFRQPGANIIETVNRVKEAIPSLKASIPSAIEITNVFDRTVTIRASLSDVTWSLVGSVFLVVLVVFFFLRSFRATVIPFVAVPVSLIGTFAVMYLCGYSLDNLSLMALTIATGFVVDDAIVVMENITRHLESGMKPMAAALLGAKEISFTVFSISVSLVAVFIPILMMGGIVGRLFREFAVTLSTAIAVSMVISLSTTPMMCAHVLKSEEDEEHGRLYRLSERFFNFILGRYTQSLRWVLDNPWLVIVVLVLVIALNFVIIVHIQKGFFPQQDTGAIVGSVQGPQDASFPLMDNSVLQLVDVIKRDPAVNYVNAYTGGGNGGFIYIALKPLNQRPPHSSAMEVIGRLRPKMNKLPVAQAFLQPAQDIRIGARGSAALYQYTIQADNVDDLNKWGPILLANVRKLPGLQDVNSDQQNGGLQTYLTYDRTAAARLAFTPQQLDSTLYSAFGQEQTSVIFQPLNQYYVVLEVAPQYWQSPEGLKNIYIPNSHGNVPIGTVATVKTNTAPLTIAHSGLFPSVTVSFNLAAGLSLSDATRMVEQMQEKLGTPSTVHGYFSGTLQAYQDSLGTEWILGMLAVLAVYIVLGILYESLMHPLTIISTIPSASVGAMLALMIFGDDLNVISMIGIVLLIGIVKKNAIMMIDFALQVEREKGMTTYDSIYTACLLRFRPILMTTMAALFGALPLAFGHGTGSELRRPLGLSIVGGLLVSQLLTLYTTPVVYLLMDRFRLWLLRAFFGRERDTLQTLNGQGAPGEGTA